MAFGQWWMFIEAVEGPIGRDRGALPFHPVRSDGRSPGRSPAQTCHEGLSPKGKHGSVPRKSYWPLNRAILLARAMAATFVGRRANNAASQSRCLVPWIFA